MRKSSLYLLASVLVTLLLGVLLFNSIQLSDFDSALGDNKQAKKELVLAHWEYIPDEIFDLFSKEYPDITVNYQHYHAAGYSDIIQQKITMGEKIDVMGVKAADFQEYILKNWLSDISEEDFTKKYRPDMTSAVKQAGDGRQYAISYKAEYYGIWYNKILFEKYRLDVPRNFSEFLNVCAELKRHDINPIVLGARDDDIAADIYYLRVIGMMEGMVTKAGQDTGTLGLFEDTQNLIAQAYISPDSANLNYQQAFDYFKNAKAAMLIAPDSSFNMAKEDFEKVCDPGVFSIPYADSTERIKTPVNYFSMLIGINSQSEHLKEAKLFLDFLSRPEIAKIYCEQTISYPTVADTDTSGLKYADLWMPLRTQTPLDIPFIWLSSNGKESINAAARRFVAGLMDADGVAAVYESVLNHQ